MKLTKTDRTLKAIFDPEFMPTANAGLFLVERLAQRIGAWRTLSERLAGRGGYESANIAAQLILGLAAGGKGLSAAEILRADATLARGLGFGAVAEESTMNRALADLAGLEQRREEDWYVRSSQPALLPTDSKQRGTRQVKGIEYADPGRLVDINRGADAILVALLKRTTLKSLLYGRWIPVFGDGSQLEVTGRCFDAALKDRNGNRSEHLAFTTIGPFLAANELRPGTKDEGLGIPPLLERTMNILQSAGLSQRPLLFLLDSAFGEDQVLRQLHSIPNAKYIVGMNDMRVKLTEICDAQPPSQWFEEKNPEPWLDAASYCSFTYSAKTWEINETFIAIRYKEKGELTYKYTFLVTNLTEKELLRERLRLGSSSHMAAAWAMYRHKQGMENYQKPALSDLGLHHPPSGRFGINQVFYSLASIAFNLATFISRVALPERLRGMRLWRMRQFLFRIAGRTTFHARAVTITLSTCVSPWIQHAWSHAFAFIERM